MILTYENYNYILSKHIHQVMVYMSVWNDSLVNCGKSEVYNSQLNIKIKSKRGNLVCDKVGINLCKLF